MFILLVEIEHTNDFSLLIMNHTLIALNTKFMMVHFNSFLFIA